MISVSTWGNIHKYEIIAYILYFIGIFFLFTDPFALKAGTTEPSYFGDFLAMIGAFCAAMYSYFIKYVKYDLHPMIKTIYGFLTSITYMYILFPFLTMSDKFFSFDPEYGTFGWLTNWTCFLEVICINAFVTGLLANIGFFASYNYFPIEIVNGALLLEPFISQAAGILLGQDEIPGFKTLIGCLLITTWFALASFGSKIKEQTQIKHKDNKAFEDISNEIELSLVE